MQHIERKQLEQQPRRSSGKKTKQKPIFTPRFQFKTAFIKWDAVSDAAPILAFQTQQKRTNRPTIRPFLIISGKQRKILRAIITAPDKRIGGGIFIKQLQAAPEMLMEKTKRKA